VLDFSADQPAMYRGEQLALCDIARLVNAISSLLCAGRCHDVH